MVSKLKRKTDLKEIIYDRNQWTLISKYRMNGKKILCALIKSKLTPSIYGSVARGDVTKNSDIDIIIPEVFSSFQIESSLERLDIPIQNRYIIQATPSHAIKAYIELNSVTTISFPLTRLKKIEREFYKFGGEINLRQIDSNRRVHGVDKRLMLIEPTKTGHIERGIVGIEDYVAKNIGISTQTILNRVNILQKREETGKTGVFIKKIVPTDFTFELVLKKLADKNPAVRRRLKNI